MKIGELARASGVSVSTLSYYVKEGLIRPAYKTGRNMAWYAPESVETVRTIRRLQKERFYPLSVIKRLLEGEESSATDMELLDAIHKVDARSSAARVTAGEAARQSRLSPAQIARLAEEGLISTPQAGRRGGYTAADVTVMTQVSRRMDAGIPFEQSVRAFAIYAGALREAARADVDALIAGAILAPGFTAQAGAHMIHVSDETLDVFVAAKRKEYNREYGSARLEELYQFEARLREVLRRMLVALSAFGLVRDAAQLAAGLLGEDAAMDDVNAAAKHYCRFTRNAGSDVAAAIAGCLQSRDYFLALEPERAAAPLPLHIMKLCWLCLAPDILGCDAAVREAEADLRRAMTAQSPGTGKPCAGP